HRPGSTSRNAQGSRSAVRRGRAARIGRVRGFVRYGRPRDTAARSIGAAAAQVSSDGPPEIPTRLELPGNRRAAGHIGAHGAEILGIRLGALPPAHGTNEVANE